MAFVRLLFWYVFCSQWRGGKYFMTRSSLIILCEYNVVCFFLQYVTMRLLRTWNWISTFLQSSIKWHSGVGIDLMNNNALNAFAFFFCLDEMRIKNSTKNWFFALCKRNWNIFQSRKRSGGSNDNDNTLSFPIFWILGSFSAWVSTFSFPMLLFSLWRSIFERPVSLVVYSTTYLASMLTLVLVGPNRLSLISALFLINDDVRWRNYTSFINSTKESILELPK